MTEKQPPLTSSHKAGERQTIITNATTRYEVDCGNGVKVEFVVRAGEPFYITAQGGEVNLTILEVLPDPEEPDQAADSGAASMLH